MYGVTHIVPILCAAGAKNDKKFGFAAGTYIGSGAATAAIVVTGLKDIHFVWMNKNFGSYTAVATTDAGQLPAPALAAGTPGSFYPIVGYIDKGAVVNHTLGTGAAATFRWLALGE